MVGVFSHQWVENEKMNFPLLRVPEILGRGSRSGSSFASFSRTGILSSGSAFPWFLHLLNGLSTYFPQVPQIPTLVLASPYIPKEGLLSGFYKAKIYIYPAFIGFAFLTSKQVSFSLWSFFILGGTLARDCSNRSAGASPQRPWGPPSDRSSHGSKRCRWWAPLPFSFCSFSGSPETISSWWFRSILSRSRSAPGMSWPALPKARAVHLCGRIHRRCRLALPLWHGPPADPHVSRHLLHAATGQFTAHLPGRIALSHLAPGPPRRLPGLFSDAPHRPRDPLYGAHRAEGDLPRYQGIPDAFSLPFRQALRRKQPQVSVFCSASFWRSVVGMVVSFVAYLALYYKFGLNTLPDEWAIETTQEGP